jgi:hypothetical protein
MRQTGAIALIGMLAAAVATACSPLDAPLGNTGPGTITTGGSVPGQFTGTNIPRETAEAFIRKQVKGISPLLLPGFVPDPGTAIQVDGSYISFTITYSANKTVYLGTLTVYPAPYHPRVPAKRMNFRSDRAAVYMVQNAGDPVSFRFITWNEPGHSGDKACHCVRYTLETDGLSQVDFFRVANSLSAER